MGNLFSQEMLVAPLGNFQCCRRIGFRQNDDKLLATKTGNKVLRTRCSTHEHFGYYTFKALIPLQVTMKIVVLLEVIDIQKQHRERLMISQGTMPGLVHE